MFSSVAAPFHVLTKNAQAFQFFHILTKTYHFLFFIFFLVDIRMGAGCCPLIFLMISDTGHLFMCLHWPFVNFLWRNVYLYPLPIFE
jgi:hypothetical protein